MSVVKSRWNDPERVMKIVSFRASEATLRRIDAESGFGFGPPRKRGETILKLLREAMDARDEKRKSAR